MPSTSESAHVFSNKTAFSRRTRNNLPRIVQQKAALIVLASFIGMACVSCASVIEGTDQPMMVSSEPVGASCQLYRDSAVVGGIPSTPQSIVVSRSKDPIIVSCELEGYLRSEEKIWPGSSDAMAGNVAVGLLSLGLGAIFVATDAASGAANEYPGQVNIRMIPEMFESAVERDRFFDQMVADFHADVAELESAVQARCRDGNNEFCRIQTEKLAQAKGDRLEKIERFRSEAKVVEQ